MEQGNPLNSFYCYLFGFVIVLMSLEKLSLLPFRSFFTPNVLRDLESVHLPPHEKQIKRAITIPLKANSSDS